MAYLGLPNPDSRWAYLGIFSESHAKLANIVCGGIEELLVAGARLPPFILLLEPITNLLQGFLRAHGEGVWARENQK